MSCATTHGHHEGPPAAFEPGAAGASTLARALRVDAEDPEVARARAAIEARLLGGPRAASMIGRYIVVERLGAGGMGIVYAAYDPELDRKVALKLLFRRDAGDVDRERLVREAKAMAKLAHPNVVHVYDVGEHEGRIFIAMEYVRGSTLRAWARAERRTWREVLAVCLDAGEGLAAAHAAGIIHRDFKPDNVLIGEDGRARVLDFGLARSASEPTSPEREASEAPEAPSRSQRGTVTRTGAVLGTPGYIAPEQLRGAAPDVRGDQYSFCATVWEALAGALPRARAMAVGNDSTAVPLVSDPSGPAAPPRGAMPRWVERVLRRGLGEHARYPTLDALLRALRRDPAVRRVRLAVATAMLATVAGAFAIGLSARAPAAGDDPCGGGAERLGEAWSGDDRERAIVDVQSQPSDFAAELAPRLRTQLDEFASHWTAQYRDACLAHQRGEQSSALLDRRMTCLHRGRSAWGTVGRVLREVRVDDLPGVALAVGTLPDPDACGDLERLSGNEVPTSPRSRALAERLSAAQTEYVLGHAEVAHAQLESLLPEVRELDDPMLAAEALLTQGKALIDLRRRGDAAAVLGEAVRAALRADADELVVEAWGQQAWAVATGAQIEHTRIPEGREIITAIAERHGDSLATLSLYNNLAGVELAAGRRSLAQPLYERIRKLAPGVSGRAAQRTLAQALVGSMEFERDPAARARLGAEAVERMRAAAGDGHPRTLTVRRLALNYHESLDEVLKMVPPLCEDLRRLEGQRGRNLAECERFRVVLHVLARDHAAAMAAARRWLAALPSDGQALPAAYVALLRGDAVTAEQGFAALAKPLEAESRRPWWSDAELGELEAAIGCARRAQGRGDEETYFERALHHLGGDGQREVSGHGRWMIRFATALRDGEFCRPRG
ncbi:MAG: serine/threonine protein kinase [Deltaproteobacteria bacterium]|nr:serine/threonine protein kinase [Deltaproteobacteria bacterium]MBK8715780.1 serine/threonine protein kinase [Deltaproteobacteria bacterium]MBP7288141.1 serine/threonine protein kinase [Nannocystaceae bacterium]